MTTSDPVSRSRADSVAHSQTLYDTHAHFFSNDLQRYPVNTANAREGEDNLRRRIQSEPLTPEHVFRIWDASDVIGGVAVQYNTVYKTDNRYVLDACERHTNRISPVVMLNAADPATPELLAKYVTERGVVGLRLFGRADADGSYPWLDSPDALRSWETANRYALTMVVMYGPAKVEQAALDRIAKLADRFPSITIALDHFAWAGYESADVALPPALTRLREQRNIFFKLTTINFHQFDKTGLDSAGFVRHAADVFGADRMMWGSDMGNTLDSYASMADRAKAAAALLTPIERKQFLCDTGAKLFSRRHA